MEIDLNLVQILLIMITLKEKLLVGIITREALSNGDKILSENYLQHADHFTRILNEKENFRKEKLFQSKSSENEDDSNHTIIRDTVQDESLNKEQEETDSKETQVEVN